MSRRVGTTGVGRVNLSQRRGVARARVWSAMPVTQHWSRVASVGEEPQQGGPPEQPEWCQALTRHGYEGAGSWDAQNWGRFRADEITITFAQTITDPTVMLEQQDANTWSQVVTGTFNNGDVVTIDGPPVPEWGPQTWDWLDVRKYANDQSGNFTYIDMQGVTVCYKPDYYFTFALDEDVTVGEGDALQVFLVGDVYNYYSDPLDYAGTLSSGETLTAYFSNDIPRVDYPPHTATIQLYDGGEEPLELPGKSGTSGYFDGDSMNWVNDPDSNNLVAA